MDLIWVVLILVFLTVLDHHLVQVRNELRRMREDRRRAG